MLQDDIIYGKNRDIQIDFSKGNAMARKGITKDQIVRCATDMILSDGISSFSMRELAGKLGVKASSLYNHYSGSGEIMKDVSMRFANEMCDRLNMVEAGYDLDDAFLNMTFEYINYALEHEGLYEAFIATPVSETEGNQTVASVSFTPIRQVISRYGLPYEDSVNITRGLRAELHGLIELVRSGFMTTANTSREETFKYMMRLFLREIKDKSGSGTKDE